MLEGGGGEDVQEEEEVDHEEVLSRMKVRSGAGDVTGATAEMRGRRCMPDAEDMSDLLLVVARAKAPREVDATFRPIEEAIFGATVLMRKQRS